MKKQAQLMGLSLALLISSYGNASLNPRNWFSSGDKSAQADKASVAPKRRNGGPDVSLGVDRGALEYFGVVNINSPQEIWQAIVKKTRQVKAQYGVNSAEYKKCLECAQNEKLNFERSDLFATIFSLVSQQGTATAKVNSSRSGKVKKTRRRSRCASRNCSPKRKKAAKKAKNVKSVKKTKKHAKKKSTRKSKTVKSVKRSSKKARRAGSKKK